MGGKDAYLAEDYTTAIGHFEALLEHPDTPTNYVPASLFLVGHAYMNAGDTRRAYQSFKRLAWDYPSSWYAKALRGRWVNRPDDLGAYVLEHFENRKGD